MPMKRVLYLIGRAYGYKNQKVYIENFDQNTWYHAIQNKIIFSIVWSHIYTLTQLHYEISLTLFRTVSTWNKYLTVQGSFYS